jgi:hypothetical protein
MRLLHQPMAIWAQGATCQEHADNGYRFFIDVHTFSQELMKGFDKVE